MRKVRLQRLFPCGKIAPLFGLQIQLRRVQLYGKKAEHRIVMSAAEIDLALARIAAEHHRKAEPHDDFALIGIRRRGVYLAERIRARIEATLKRPIMCGILDITLYRDDLTAIASHPMLRETSIDFDINNLSLVLVDDVLYTGGLSGPPWTAWSTLGGRSGFNWQC